MCLATLGTTNGVTRRAGRTLGESGALRDAAVLRRWWNLHDLRFGRANHGRADLLGFHDGPRGADDLRVRHDPLVVEDFRIGDDALPVDDARFDVGPRLVDYLGLYDGLGARDHVLVDDRPAAVDELALCDDPRRLLHRDEPWTALGRGTDGGALGHAVQIVGGVRLGDARIAQTSRRARRWTGGTLWGVRGIRRVVGFVGVWQGGPLRRSRSPDLLVDSPAAAVHLFVANVRNVGLLAAQVPAVVQRVRAVKADYRTLPPGQIRRRGTGLLRGVYRLCVQVLRIATLREGK